MGMAIVIRQELPICPPTLIQAQTHIPSIWRVDCTLCSYPNWIARAILFGQSHQQPCMNNLQVTALQWTMAQTSMFAATSKTPLILTRERPSTCTMRLEELMSSLENFVSQSAVQQFHQL